MVNARPPAASTSEQHLQALHVLKTHAFIHIPKTGGTTIEALAPGQFSVYKQTQDCCKLGGNPSVPIALKWCCKPASPSRLGTWFQTFCHDISIALCIGLVHPAGALCAILQTGGKAVWHGAAGPDQST